MLWVAEKIKNKIIKNQKKIGESHISTSRNPLKQFFFTFDEFLMPGSLVLINLYIYVKVVANRLSVGICLIPTIVMQVGSAQFR